MIAFVTGGTGFIGSHLVEALLESKKFTEIRCLVRNKEKWLSGLDYKKVLGDLHDLKAIENGLNGADVVFHVAGIVKAPTKKEFTQANVDATEDLLRLAQKKGVNNLVVLSSLAAAGPSTGNPKNESDPMHPVSKYGESKKEMEGRIRQLVNRESSIKIIRPPAVYGPREDQIFSFFKSCSMGICPIVGDGAKPKVSMVFVSDLVGGILKASEKNDPGIHLYFITGDKLHTWNEIRSITEKVFGKKTLAVNIKPVLVKKAASVIESVASLFGKYPVINREKAGELVLEWTCTSDKAARELGYKPKISLEEGISKTIHWYKKHNWL